MSSPPPQAPAVTTPTTVLSNYVPPQLERHIQFMDFNSKGDLFLGTSSLTSRFWTGSLWYYGAGLEPDNINSDSCMTGVHTATGVLDGRFLKDDLMVVGLDSGGIELVRLTHEEEEEEGSGVKEVRYYLEEQSPLEEHDDLLTGLDLFSDGSLATVGADNKICVWDSQTALSLQYKPAHSGILSDVSCHRTDNNLLSTCSRSVDCSVRLWDTRKAKAATTLAILEEESPSSVSWVGEQYLVVGCLTGSLVMLDTRNNNSLVTSINNNNRPVYNARLSPDATRLAVCYNDTMVDVVRISEGKLEVELRETKHSDFVRGLAWADNNTVWSGGWDQAVHSYKL